MNFDSAFIFARMKLALKFILLLFLIPIFGHSQIVNIENKRLSAKKEGFSGSLDVHGNFTVNTKTLLQFGTAVKLAYLKGKHYALILGDQTIVKSGDESFINKGFEHLRYNFQFKDSGRVVYEAYHQGQFNKVQRINMRLLLGTGFRFLVLDQNNYQLNLGSGFMGEYEELIEGGNSTDILSANYISFDGQFFDNFGMNTITYFQPKLADWGNYRISNETSLRFRFNQHLTFKLVYQLAHDSRDIEGVRKTNYAIKNTLSFNF